MPLGAIRLSHHWGPFNFQLGGSFMVRKIAVTSLIHVFDPWNLDGLFAVRKVGYSFPYRRLSEVK